MMMWLTLHFLTFGGIKSEYFEGVALDDVLVHKLPAKRITLANGEEKYVTTVYDLLLANYGVDRGLNDENCATNYDEIKAYSPAWAEQVTGLAVKILSALHVNLLIMQKKHMVVQW